MKALENIKVAVDGGYAVPLITIEGFVKQALTTPEGDNR